MSVTIKFNLCDYCHQSIDGSPDVCDWCYGHYHDECMSPPQPDYSTGDIYNYCLECAEPPE